MPAIVVEGLERSFDEVYAVQGVDLKIRRGMMDSLSGNLATMCPGVPYAIAAKFC